MKETKDRLPDLPNEKAVQEFEKIIHGTHTQYELPKQVVCEEPVWWKRPRPGIVRRYLSKLFPRRRNMQLE